MHFCNRHLSPLQRRTIQLFSTNLGLTAVLLLMAHKTYLHEHPSVALMYLLAILPAIPVIGIIAVVGRYLARENDEFVRMMVVQALLWGLGITFVTDTVLGGLYAAPSIDRLIAPLNLDLFVVSAAVALRIQMWRNR